MFLKRLSPVIAGLVLFCGAAQAQTPTTAPVAAAPMIAAPTPVVAAGDVIETLRTSGQFTIFLRSADAVGLTSFVKGLKDVTVIAPTDGAFRALPQADLVSLMSLANRADLQKLVLYHLVGTRVPTSEFKGASRQATTLAKLPLAFDGGVTPDVNGVPIVQADVMATNGVIHVVGQLLNPAKPPSPEPAAEPAKPSV